MTFRSGPGGVGQAGEAGEHVPAVDAREANQGGGVGLGEGEEAAQFGGEWAEVDAGQGAHAAEPGEAFGGIEAGAERAPLVGSGDHRVPRGQYRTDDASRQMMPPR